MNRTYKTVFNHRLGIWQAVAETAKGTHKSGRSRTAANALVLGVGLTLTAAAQAQYTIDGGATETVPGSQTSPWNIGGNLNVGYSGSGTLNITSGGTVSNTAAYLGYNAGSTGTVTVDGSASTWTNSGGLLVGVYGTATLDIQNSGTVSNTIGYIGRYSGSSGTVTVDGSGSTWTNSSSLVVGLSGTGTLDISNGGTVSNTAGFIGDDSGSSGTVTVDGSGSTWTNSSSLVVGNSGTGTLNIQNGGTVSNTAAQIGYNAGSTGTVTVDGSGSTWTNSGNLYVGLYDTGTLNIQNSGTVSNTAGYIGYTSGSTAAVTVDGNGSTWTNSGNLYIGESGTGTLDISNGGTVSSIDAFIGDEIGASGTVRVDGSGSSWTIASELLVGNFGNGTLDIMRGATVSNVHGYIGYVGHIAGSSGTVTVDGNGSTWTNSSSLNVVIGALNIQNGGKVTASFTRLTSGATSAGTLNLNGTSSARGVLETSYIDKGAGSATFNWNGGILRATANEANFLRTLDNADINIQSGGAYLDTNGMDIGITQALAGTGGLTKQGNGTLTLTGVQTYTGGTTVSAGTLALSGAGTLAATGAVVVANGATFDISAAAGDRSIGALSGAGDVELGANSLSMGSSTSSTFSGALSGTGGLTKLGAGNLILSGANTYTGGTTVSAGTLSVNGSVVGTTTVSSGAALGGSGTVGDVALSGGGILAPGNSIGTLTVNGDLSFGSGSIYRVEANAAGASDKTVVNGNVTLAGRVDVQAENGSYADRTSYTILSHTGTRTGVFDSVTSNLAFLTPSLSYAANAVELSLERNSVSFVSVAETRNQRAVASGVEAWGAGTVYDAVTGLSAAQARAAYDALSGTQHAAASQVAMNMGRGFSNALMNRAAVAGGRFGGASSLRYASLDLSGITSMQGLFASPHQLGRTLAPTVSDASPMGRFNAAGGSTPNAGIWFQVLGGKGEVKGDGNGSGSDYSSTAFLAGYDAMVSADWLMGVAVGYGKTQWDAEVPATGNVDSPYAALYGRYSSGPWQIRLNGGYADNRFETTRTIALGATSSQARSKHSGQEWSGAAEAEYALTEAAGWAVKPLAAVRYAYLDEDGFTESGSAAALKVNGRSTQQANLGIGSRFVRGFDEDKGSLELRAMVTHLAGDTDAPVTASFVGGNSTFNVDGTPLRRTALVLGAGISHQIANKLSAYADLGYETRGNGQNNAVVALGLQYRW
jgi:outer membrane autotransporter protein